MEIDSMQKVGKEPNFYFHQKELEDLVNRLDRLAKDGHVPRETAERFVAQSTWWYVHPYGLRRSPGDAGNIKGPDPNWNVYHGNSFVVGRALLLCRKELEGLLHSLETYRNFGENTIPKLRKKLTEAIRWSVRDSHGALYRQFPMEGSRLAFGNHFIDVDDFIQTIFEIVPVDRFIVKILEEKKREEHTKKAVTLFRSVLDDLDLRTLPKSITFFLERMRSIEPSFSMKSTNFKKFRNLVEHFEEKGLLRTQKVGTDWIVAEVMREKKDLSKAARKRYRAMLEAEDTHSAADLAIQVLANADHWLQMRTKGATKSVFSALARAASYNGHPPEMVLELLFVLFSARDAGIRSTKGNTPDISCDEISSQVGSVLDAAGFKLPD
jgi:hypothetical protein